MATIHVIMKQEKEALQSALTPCVWGSLQTGDWRAWEKMENIQEREKRGGLQSRSALFYMLHTVTHKKIILSPVSCKHPQVLSHIQPYTHFLPVCVLIPVSICVHRRHRHVCTSFACPPGPISIPRLWRGAIDAAQGASNKLLVTVGNTRTISRRNLPHLCITHQANCIRLTLSLSFTLFNCEKLQQKDSQITVSHWIYFVSPSSASSANLNASWRSLKSPKNIFWSRCLWQQERNKISRLPSFFSSSSSSPMLGDQLSQHMSLQHKFGLQKCWRM